MATATATMIVPTTTQPTLSMNISRLESVLSPCSAIRSAKLCAADDEDADDEDRDRDARHEQCGERDLQGDAARSPDHGPVSVDAPPSAGATGAAR